ncbi:unnamed protein product, partial [Rotaria magnacalcarata]
SMYYNPLVSDMHVLLRSQSKLHRPRLAQAPRQQQQQQQQQQQLRQQLLRPQQQRLQPLQ